MVIAVDVFRDPRGGPLQFGSPRLGEVWIYEVANGIFADRFESLQ